MRGKKIRVLLLLGLLLLSRACILVIGRHTGGEVVINEVCSWNAGVRGTNREFDDYIELYNRTDETVSLDGWYLSDKENKLRLCELTDISIKPHDYVLVFASGTGEEPNEVAFKIDAGGEKLFLTDEEGELQDSVHIPELEADTVWARSEDGTGEWDRLTPSPGRNNEDSEPVRDEVLEKPVFSEQSGFYGEPFSLEIWAEPGGTVYYTLDGSDPTKDSEVYKNSIYIEDVSDRPNVYNSIQNVVYDWKEYTPPEEPVDKAVVVRAMTMDSRGNTSDIATATYFVGLEEYQEVDVLSMVADPEDMFGDDGIHVTGAAYDEWYLSGSEEEVPEPIFVKGGRSHEIEGSIQLFEKGQEVLNEPAGFRIQGNVTRYTPRKKFSVYAREEYGGSEMFDYELFEGRKVHSFVLQNQFSSAFLPTLTDTDHVAAQSCRPVVVFLNGEYWYTVYMQEKLNRYYLHERYGVDPDNVTIISDGLLETGDRSGLHAYERLLEYVSGTDFFSDEAYEQLQELMDVQSFIEWMCANIYLCNMDVSETHNYMLWKTNDPEDGPYGDCRWRWMLYDMDNAETLDPEYYKVENAAQVNSFTEVMEVQRTIMNEHSIFKALKSNETFRKSFTETFMEMANTVFSAETVSEKLEEWGEDLSWNDCFFEQRYDYIVPYMNEEFELSE